MGNNKRQYTTIYGGNLHVFTGRSLALDYITNAGLICNASSMHAPFIWPTSTYLPSIYQEQYITYTRTQSSTAPSLPYLYVHEFPRHLHSLQALFSGINATGQRNTSSHPWNRIPGVTLVFPFYVSHQHYSTFLPPPLSTKHLHCMLKQCHEELVVREKLLSKQTWSLMKNVYPKIQRSIWLICAVVVFWSELLMNRFL